MLLLSARAGRRIRLLYALALPGRRGLRILIRRQFPRRLLRHILCDCGAAIRGYLGPRYPGADTVVSCRAIPARRPGGYCASARPRMDSTALSASCRPADRPGCNRGTPDATRL